jgi:hypothetical protein
VVDLVPVSARLSVGSPCGTDSRPEVKEAFMFFVDFPFEAVFSSKLIDMLANPECANAANRGFLFSPRGDARGLCWESKDKGF